MMMQMVRIVLMMTVDGLWRTMMMADDCANGADGAEGTWWWLMLGADDDDGAGGDDGDGDV